MIIPPDDRHTIDNELARAAEALAIGNDGMARVCCRRASGVALRVWFRARKKAVGPLDAQSLLRIAGAEWDFPPDAKEAAARLCAPAAGQPPGDPESPPAPGPSSDPIGDARIIIAAIEGYPEPRDA